MNKGGQFFLIAAIIIVGLIIGLATAVNSIRVGDRQEAFYNLAEEIDDEVKEVLNYGKYNSMDPALLMRGFLGNYTDYIAQEEVLFVYGNATNLTALFFEEAEGSVGISTGNIPADITIQYTTGDTADVATVDDNNDGLFDRVTVLIKGIEYEYNLRPGENFYFVIIKESGGDENGERFVATGK